MYSGRLLMVKASWSSRLPALAVIAAESAAGRQGRGRGRSVQIASGWAYRFRNSSNGCRQILDFLLPGEIVGLQAAMLGVIDHSVRSLTPLHVSTIDARLVAEAFRSEPNLAMRLSRHRRPRRAASMSC